MARKLKTYQTSLGFYDLVVAAPSMKAALEAWGSNSNLFHQGFAHEVDDEDIARAALAKPGLVLKRPVGTALPFTDHPGLPIDLAPRSVELKTEKLPAKHPQTRAVNKADGKALHKAARALERPQERRQAERRRADAAEARLRVRRERAVETARSAISEAEREHQRLASAIEQKRSALEAQARREDDRWMKQEQRLKAALERAKSSD